MFGKVWILILLVLVLSFRLPLLAQSPTPEEDILNASGMMKDGFYSDALDLLNSVSQNHAGTEYDAWSRMEKAFLLARAYRDYAGAQAVTESIVNDFPKTEFYLVAKENLLDLQLLSKEISIDAYLEHLDLLIQETGGAGLWVDHHIVSPVSFLEPVAQEGYLGELYFAAAARTAARPKEELTPELLNKAERLARFYRNEFSDSREAVLLLERIAFARSGQDDYTPKPMDSEGPRIENLERSTVSPVEVVRLSLNDGPASESQIDIESLKVFINAEACEKENLLVESKTGQDESIFENLTLGIAPVEGGWNNGPNSLEIIMGAFQIRCAE